jgi:hypothetical protein
VSETENWLSTDEADDTAGSVGHALLCWGNVPDDTQAWKWMALAIHSALQGGSVCHLVTTAAPVGAVCPKNAAEFLHYIEESQTDPDARPPEARLMALPDLLKAIRKPHSAGDRSNQEGIPLSDAELAWLCNFHTVVRNQFVHFEPMGWSLEVSGIPAIAALTAQTLRDIVDAGWTFRQKDRAWLNAFKADLERLGSIANQPC